jgi:hypothetical protein
MEATRCSAMTRPVDAAEWRACVRKDWQIFMGEWSRSAFFKVYIPQAEELRVQFQQLLRSRLCKDGERSIVNEQIMQTLKTCVR